MNSVIPFFPVTKIFSALESSKLSRLPATKQLRPPHKVNLQNDQGLAE